MSFWDDNPHLVKEVERMIREGKSAGTIAKTLKVTRNMIVGKAVRMKLRLPGVNQHAMRHPEGVELPSPPRRFSWEQGA